MLRKSEPTKDSIEGRVTRVGLLPLLKYHDCILDNKYIIIIIHMIKQHLFPEKKRTYTYQRQNRSDLSKQNPTPAFFEAIF